MASEMSKELRERCLLNNEEILLKLGYKKDSLKGWWLEPDGYTVSHNWAIKHAIKPIKSIPEIQLDKAYPIIEAETLKKVGEWLDRVQSLQTNKNKPEVVIIHQAAIDNFKRGEIP